MTLSLSYADTVLWCSRFKIHRFVAAPPQHIPCINLLQHTHIHSQIWLLHYKFVHCKEPIPKIRNKYSQKRNCAATVPISTFMCLWPIYIFPWSICLFSCRKYVDRSWEYKNRLQKNECGNGTETAQFPEKEYINGIFVAVCLVSIKYFYWQSRLKTGKCATLGYPRVLAKIPQVYLG
jgi:hypothetical protein